MITRKAIEESKECILVQTEEKSDVLIIAFWGLMAKIGFPVFEFFNMLSPLWINVIYIRDLNQSRYHWWLRWLSSSLHETADIISKHIAAIEPRKTIFLWNSAGWYAAILFGILLDCDEVHAFAPQSYLSLLRKLYSRDFRYRLLHVKVFFIDILCPKQFLYNDLNYLKKYPYKSNIIIYYDPEHKQDTLHAQRISKLPHTILHRYSWGHSVIKKMKQSWELLDIITHAIKT